MRTIIAFLIMCSVAYADYAVLITAKQYRPGINEIGDVVAVFPDHWKFTETEKSEFLLIKSIPNNSSISAIPETKVVDDKEYWKDGITFKEIKKSPKYKLRWESGTFHENYSRYIENTTTTLSQ